MALVFKALIQNHIKRLCISLHESTFLSLHRFKSTGAAAEQSPLFSDNNNDDVNFPTLDFPGGRVPFTAQMKFISSATDQRMPCYRVLDDDGYVLPGTTVFEQVKEEMAVKMYSKMGDFHAGLNFAAVMDAPVVFICRNNGWAISTPVSDQFRSDGIVTKGQGYGITSIRVDGNDALAVYNAIRVAREMAINQQKPILVEAMTYRVSHHSTSDDSTKYRPTEEIEHWKTARSPLARFRKWIQRNGWWSDEDEHQLRANIRKQVLQAIQEAEKTEKPSLGELFTDVYDKLPSNLIEQEKSLRDIVMRHPKDYPADVPV